MKVLLSMLALTFSLSSFSAIDINEVKCVRELLEVDCYINNQFHMKVETACYQDATVDLKDGSTVNDRFITSEEISLSNNVAGIYHVDKAIKGAVTKSRARKAMKSLTSEIPKCDI